MAQPLPPIGAEVQQTTDLPPIGAEVPSTTRSPNFTTTNEPPTPSMWEQANTPLIPHIANAAHAIADYLDAPKLDRSKTMAQIRGFFAGATTGAGDVLSSFTSPIGLALTLAGLGPESKIAEVVPGLKALTELPAVQTLQRVVRGGAGTAIGAHGAAQVVSAPTYTGKAQGLAELAAGGTSAALDVVGPTLVRGALNPTEQAAVAFGREQGIPIDVATATGSRTARALQKRAAHSIGGEGIAERFIARQEQALTRVGQAQAAAAGPTTTEELAGQALIDALETKITDHQAAADTAYTDARTRARQQRTTVQTGETVTDTGILDASGRPITRTTPITQTFEAPIDISAVKSGLRPLYDSLKRESALVPLQGGKARALVALDRLMNAPDTVSLLDAERATSDLGALAGHPELPELRTAGEGVAARAFQTLRSQVDAHAARGGVLDSLQEGRAATKAKYATADLLERVRAEPVQAYRQMVAPEDSGINLLRAVQAETPTVLPRIANAYLNDLLKMASAEGGFDRAARLQTEWLKLGSATKQILFGQPLQHSLDRFFLLAKRIAENPNPSGTAAVNNVFNWVSTLPAYGVAKLLYTERGAKAVAGYLEASGRGASPAARQAALLNVLVAARQVGLNLPNQPSNTGTPR
jgi:hypothetical protein